nr:EamA-like transporter family [uncultured organism]
MLYLVLASLLWGTTGTAASFLPASVSPLATGAATMGVGGALLLVVGWRRALPILRSRAALPWIVFGAVGVVIYPLAFYSAMSTAGVAVGNVVSLGSAPVFAALFEFAIERTRLTVRWSIATALAVAGVAALGITGDVAHSGSDAAGSDSGSPMLGVGLALVAGLSYAGYTYAARRLLQQGHPSGGVVGAVFGVGAVPLLVVLLVVGAPILQTGSSIGITLYLAIGPMFAAYLLFGRGLRRVSSSTATTITLLEPVVATVLAVVVVGERLDAPAWFGVAAILLGILIMIVRPRPRAARVPRLSGGG